MADRDYIKRFAQDRARFQAALEQNRRDQWARVSREGTRAAPEQERKDSINRRIATGEISLAQGHVELDTFADPIGIVMALRGAARDEIARRTFAQEIEARREERGPNPMAAAEPAPEPYSCDCAECEPERDHGPDADYEALIMDERGDEYL